MWNQRQSGVGISGAVGGLMFLFALMGLSCANQVSPTGGPKDEDPPEIERTIPENQSLFFSDREVIIYFSEFVRPATYGQEIFISPLPETRPKVVLLNKKLRIKFNEDLRPNTTYVISLTDIKDQNESNPLAETFILAFSTGAVLDSMAIEGKVYEKEVGTPAKEMLVMLFEEDSIQGNDFFKKRPSYISKVGEDGSFTFRNLRNTTYEIYATEDADRSNTYSQPNERIAIAKDSLVTWPDSNTLIYDTLYAFLPDGGPPRIQKYNWVNDSVLIFEMNEGLISDSLIMLSYDTLGNDPMPVEEFTYIGGSTNELMVWSPRPRSQYSDLKLFEVTDSLGNSMDSLMRIVPNRQRELPNILVKQPEFDFLKEKFSFTSSILFSNADSGSFVLSDTFNNMPDTTGWTSIQQDSFQALKPKVPELEFEFNQFEVNLIPSFYPKSEPFDFELAGSLFGNPDTTYTFTLKWPDKEDYGILDGRIEMPEGYTDPFVFHLLNGKEIIRTVFDTTYAFRYLPAKSLGVKVILDTDGNQVWSPGSLTPYKLPEKVIVHPEEISIRANWEFEDYEIIVKLPNLTANTTADSLANQAETEAPDARKGNKK